MAATGPDAMAGGGGSGRGGSRPGAGRKAEGYIAKGKGDMAYAKALVRALMRDEAQPMELRARCALAVLEGKAGARGRPAAEPSQGDGGP